MVPRKTTSSNQSVGGSSLSTFREPNRSNGKIRQSLRPQTPQFRVPSIGASGISFIDSEQSDLYLQNTQVS